MAVPWKQSIWPRNERRAALHCLCGSSSGKEDGSESFLRGSSLLYKNKSCEIQYKLAHLQPCGWRHHHLWIKKSSLYWTNIEQLTPLLLSATTEFNIQTGKLKRFTALSCSAELIIMWIRFHSCYSRSLLRCLSQGLEAGVSFPG